MPRALVIFLALLALALSGCGEEGAATSTSATPAADRAKRYAESIANAPGPTVQIPQGSPPKKLAIKDLKIGKGRAAQNGDEVTVQYVGISWEHKKYTNSWTYPEPPTFVVGEGRLPRGFEKGILGMKAGGSRQLIVSPTGLSRPGLEVATHDPDATVVFIVDMLKVR